MFKMNDTQHTHTYILRIRTINTEKYYVFIRSHLFRDLTYNFCLSRKYEIASFIDLCNEKVKLESFIT